METVVVQLTHAKALKLLKELEELKLIKLVSRKKSEASISGRFEGKLSPQNAKLLQKHIKESRKQWDQSF